MLEFTIRAVRLGFQLPFAEDFALKNQVPAPARLVIASRQSRLALWQAEHIRTRLRDLHPQSRIEILALSTRGDEIVDRSLAQLGGKGLFIKELEVAMAEGRAQLAVHSLKDVPMQMPEGFALAAITARENPCDAFVSNRYGRLAALPRGAVVGTSSLRREAILRAAYPGLRIETLRGNLDTRLRKLDDGQYDAIILAAAGLIRLGLEPRITTLLSPEESLPAPGQGALAIEVRTGDAAAMAAAAPLDDAPTSRCVAAERAFSRALGGSCRLPLGAYALLKNGVLWLRGFVATADGRQMVSGDVRGAPADAENLGQELARQLRAQGADGILAVAGQ